MSNSGEKGVDEALEKFKAELKGWRSSPDGEDFCPDCWPKKLARLRINRDNSNSRDEEIINIFTNDSTPLDDIAKSRKIKDGYMALCSICKKEAFAPLT